jgi:glycosyltransferase involved in cell wall biosynthesis
MDPLRILHVVPYSPGAWAYGGIPRVVGALSRGLTGRGHEVTVVTTDAKDRRERLAPSSHERSRLAAFSPNGLGYDQRVFRNLSNRLAYDAQFFVPWGFRGFLRANAARFDIAHLHAFRNLPVTWAALALQRAEVPYVATPNGTGPLIERRRVAKRIYDLLFQRVALRGAARLLAVTQAEISDLARMGVGRERLELVPNPLDLEEFEPEVAAGRLRERLGLGDAPLVVYLGRLSPRKRLDTLVQAFGRLQDECAQLVIAGSDMGALASVQREVRAAGLERRVVFPGLLVGRERLEALRDADVVSYATEDEIFGLVPFEALLVGTPVVVADDSGCGELVAGTGGGRIVPPGDPVALASALAEILASPERWRRDAALAAEHVRRELGNDTVCLRLEAVYRDVIASARSARPAAP